MKPLKRDLWDLQSPFVWGCLGAAAYILLWTIIYSGLWGHDGHWVSTAVYEAKYPYIFARELFRTGNFFLFSNPFGTLEVEPKLFNLYATVLRFFYPIWNHHLAVFDHVLGIGFSFLLFREIRKAIKNKVPAFLSGLFFVGGGVAALIHNFVPENDWKKTYYYGIQPWVSLAPATSWIFFQYLLFLCLRRFNEGKTVAASALSLGLSLLHPLFGTLGILSSLPSLILFAKSHKLSLEKVALPIALTLINAGFLYYCAVYWPEHSVDANYFKNIYWNTSATGMFRVGPMVFLATFLLPTLYFAGNLRAKSPGERSAFFKSHLPYLTLAGLILLICMASWVNHPLVPQSGRWALVSVYWILLIFSINAGIRAELKSRTVSWIVLLLLVDGISGAFVFRGLGSKYVRPHYFLADDLNSVLQRLKELPPGLFVYYRSCEESKRYAGDFEYLLMSETQHRALISHGYFTPFMPEKEQALNFCAAPSPEIFERVAAMSDYVLLPRNSLGSVKLDKFKEVPLGASFDLALFRKD